MFPLTGRWRVMMAVRRRWSDAAIRRRARFARSRSDEPVVTGTGMRSSGVFAALCPGPQNGFTLLELIVVILLLSILLGFAVPAFRDGGFTASKDSAAREILHSIKKLKITALNRQSIHKLHLSLSENRMWITREDKPGDEAPPRQLSERSLANDVRIAHVRFPGDRVVRTGEAVIAFYPQGYSDRAVIRLTDGDHTPTDLVVEAFLPMALIVSNDGAADF